MTIAPTLVAPPDTGRLFAAPGPSLAEHLEMYGDLPGNVDLPELVEQAGLLGRGGAAFPSARKLRTIASRGNGAAKSVPTASRDTGLSIPGMRP